MNTELYPIPADESSLDPLLRPFLENKVGENALEPDNAFIIVLLGHDGDGHEVREKIKDIIESSDERIQVAGELNQVKVIGIDERRLDTFSTSLLYNLLELDQTARLQETIDRDQIADEDVRKIDYYLEKVNQYFDTVIQNQNEEFQNSLENLFPVTLEDGSTEKLFDTFEDRLAASNNARIDYLLLAKAASEELDRARQLFKTARDRDLDQSKYLSPSSGSGGGYTRIIEYGYDQRDNDFRSEFSTAIQKVEQADTLNLRNKLERLSTSPNLQKVYSQRPDLLRVVARQYDGVGSDMAGLLVRTVNVIQTIESNASEVDSGYEDTKQSLDNAIERLKDIYDEIENHSEAYPSGKIQHDSGIIGDLKEFRRVANRFTSTSAKFVLGYDRESRSSLYATLEENITTRRQELESREADLSDHTAQIDGFENRLETNLEDIDTAYSTIEESSVAIDLPDNEAIKQAVTEECESIITDLKSELPGLDFSNDADELREVQEEWEELLTDAHHDINQVFDTVDNLQSMAEDVEDLEKEREECRGQIRSIEEIIGGDKNE
jgi:hypothetical protein